MTRILIAGLALALSAGGASALSPQSPPIDKAYRDDVSCAVLYMAVAAKGEDPGSAALGFYYFVGRLEGRLPAVDWRPHVLGAAGDAGAEFLDAHGERCGNILIENGRAMGGVDDQITRWGQGEGAMGAALQALRAPAEAPSSGW